MIVWMRKGGNIIRTVLCCIVYDSCAQWYAHTCEQLFLNVCVGLGLDIVCLFVCLRLTFMCLLLARLMGQYCFAGCCLSSSVTLPACGPAGRRAHGRSARRQPGAWAIGRPTLHGGPVRLRPVRATPYCVSIDQFISLLLAPCGSQGCKWVSV